MPRPCSDAGRDAAEGLLIPTAPGPPDPPIVPGHLGAPSREQLDAMAATLSVFDWLEANDLMKGEVERLYSAFMFEYGDEARRWLVQSDPPPSWQQMAQLLNENKELLASRRAVLKKAERALNALDPDQGNLRVDTAFTCLEGITEDLRAIALGEGEP